MVYSTKREEASLSHKSKGRIILNGISLEHYGQSTIGEIPEHR